MNSTLRFNLSLPGLDPVELSARYRAALEMAEMADRAGFDAITIDEHHGAEDGWMSAPMAFGAMVVARTERITIRLQALLLPLHDPLRAAEDLIVLDLASRGRVLVTLGVGYRPEEYLAHQKEWKSRGALMDKCVAELLRAWRGELIEREGSAVAVTPRPFSSHPPLMIGGSSQASVRRAVRFGLPYAPPAKIPPLEDYYRQLCAETGTEPLVDSPSQHIVLLFVAEDPDRAWKELGHHLLHEATTYASWQTPDITSSVTSHVATADDLRAEGIYQIMTPDQVLAWGDDRGPDAMFVLHPLCGGMPLEPAWDCLRLYSEQVLPRLSVAPADPY